MTEDKLKAYYSLFGDAWKLFKAHCNARTDTEWADLMTAAGALSNRYKDMQELSTALALAVINEVQRTGKEAGKE